MSQPGSVLTKSEYARLHGVKPHAVSMWIARGHLTAPALRPDEQIDVALADEQLRDRLDALKSTGKGQGPQNLFDGAAPDESAGKVEDASLLALRRRRLQIEIEDKEEQRAIARAELLPAAEVAAIWAREVNEIWQALDQWLPDLVTKLGGARSEIDLARRELRVLRQRLAETTEAAADAALKDRDLVAA